MQYLGGEALEEVPLGWVVPVGGLEAALSHYDIVRGDAALQEVAGAAAAVARAAGLVGGGHSPGAAEAVAAGAVTRAGIARATRLARLEDAVGRVAQDGALAAPAALPVHIHTPVRFLVALRISRDI